MNTILRFLLEPTEAPRSVLLHSDCGGTDLLYTGHLKYIDPGMGVVRFTRIGFTHPYFTAHFVGTFEVLCGLLLVLGLGTRIVSIPLLIVITTAITTTKVPELFRANQGFWYMVSDARTDFAMFCPPPPPINSVLSIVYGHVLTSHNSILRRRVLRGLLSVFLLTHYEPTDYSWQK